MPKSGSESPVLALNSPAIRLRTASEADFHAR